jgi:hypothetical protein
MSLTDEDKEWIEAQLKRVETAFRTELHEWAVDARQRSHAAFAPTE